MSNLNLKFFSEEQFFNIKDNSTTDSKKGIVLPMVPWTQIQFRTATLGKVDDADSLKNLSEDEIKSLRNQYDFNKDSEWTDVAYKNIKNSKSDNYFESMSLDDNGGLVNCELMLFDSEMEGLEDIIVKSIISTKIGDEYFKDKTNKEQFTLQFSEGGLPNINFRVRYGYSDNVISDDVISETEQNSDAFKNRVNSSKMVMKSPWLYFQMLDCKFAIIDRGLTAQIKGMSIGRNFLSNQKIIERNNLLEGTPELLLDNLAGELMFNTNGRVRIADFDTGKSFSPATEKFNYKAPEDKDYIKSSDRPIQWAKAIKERTGSVKDMTENMYNERNNFIAQKVEGTAGEKEEIILKNAERDLSRAAVNKQQLWMLQLSLQMGGEDRYETDKYGKVNKNKKINSYMSVKNLLDDYCSKVPSRYYFETEEGIETISKNNEIRNILGDNSDPITVETDTNKKITITRDKLTPLKYTYSVNEINSTTGRYVKLRFYYQTPIIKDIEKVAIRKYTFRNYSRNLIKTFGVSSSLDFVQMNQSIAVLNNEVNKVFAIGKSGTGVDDNQSGGTGNGNSMDMVLGGNNISLVSNVFDSNSDDSNSSNIVNSIINNMNQQMFSGTIEIPGDPYYLFSGHMQPYAYGIYIEVSRKKLTSKSYLSGYYLLKNIKHNISTSGYTTTLTLQKFPTNNKITLEKAK